MVGVANVAADGLSTGGVGNFLAIRPHESRRAVTHTGQRATCISTGTQAVVSTR